MDDKRQNNLMVLNFIKEENINNINLEETVDETVFSRVFRFYKRY